MTENCYYVYALKDPRESPARTFYIGKGTGIRAYQHFDNPDKSKKYSRIKEITESGKKPIVDILISNLTEFQALKLEAELISTFGTEKTGGILTNAVIPSGIGGSQNHDSVKVPKGVVELAQLGLALLKSSVYQLVRENGENGIKNSDAARLLGLRSDYRGNQKDYLSYSILGILIREGKVERVDDESGKITHRIVHNEASGH